MPRHQGEQTPRARVQAARHTGTWVHGLLQCYLLRRVRPIYIVHVTLVKSLTAHDGAVFRNRLLRKVSCINHISRKNVLAQLWSQKVSREQKSDLPYDGGFGHDECVTAHRPSAEDSRCCRRPRSHTRAHYSRPQMTLRTAMVATSLAPSQSPESSEAGTGTTACRPGPTSPRRRSSG